MEPTYLKESVGGNTELSRGKYRAKLVAADKWGSTAFYDSVVLKRDGSRVFHKGLQMFQDHLSESENWERPEGSVANLVGKLVSDATYDEAGEDGPGLYADVEFYPSYVNRIAELKEDVGLSIRADALTESGERDGRIGPVLVAMLKADSVDVVTRAGAGGKLTRIRESDTGLAGRPIESKEKSGMTDVTKEDFEALSAKITDLPTLFVDALKTAGLVSAPQGSEVVDAAAQSAEATATNTETNSASATTTETATATAASEPVNIDFGQVVEALRNEGLPGAVAGAVVADIKGGKSIEDAVQVQVKLREAFIAGASETGTVHLQESDKVHGLARAVKILG